MQDSMKQEIAEKVIEILLTADGGCEYCVSSLLRLFCKEFPGYKKLVEDIFEKSFSKTLSLVEDNETNQSKSEPNEKERMYHLHGWDDEKIYFWDEEKGKEYCINDENDLYDHLLKICIEYFKKKEVYCGKNMSDD